MIYVWCVIKVFLIDPCVWLFKHKIVLIAVAVAIGGLWAYQSCNRANPETKKQTTAEKLAPTIQEASYILQTYSSVYYVVKFEQPSSDEVILLRWYEWNGKKWTLQQSEQGVPFDRSTQGDFRIIKR